MPRHACHTSHPGRRRYPSTPTRPPGALTGDQLILELSALLHLWPAEIDLGDAQGHARIIAALARALRAQRRDARAGRWSYDVARHARLLELHRVLTVGPRRSHVRVR